MSEHITIEIEAVAAATTVAVESTNDSGNHEEKGVNDGVIQQVKGKANAKGHAKAKGKAKGKKNKGNKKAQQVNKVAGRVEFLTKMIETLGEGEIQPWKLALMQQYNIQRVGMSRRNLYRLGPKDKRTWCRSCALPYLSNGVNDEAKEEGDYSCDNRFKLLNGPLSNMFIPGENKIVSTKTSPKAKRQNMSDSWTIKDYENKEGIFKVPTTIERTAEPKVCSLCRYGRRYTNTKNKEKKT